MTQQQVTPLEEYLVISGLVFTILLSSFFLLGSNLNHDLKGLRADIQTRLTTTLALLHL